jgi:hypothetical protein
MLKDIRRELAHFIGPLTGFLGYIAVGGLLRSPASVHENAIEPNLKMWDIIVLNAA